MTEFNKMTKSSLVEMVERYAPLHKKNQLLSDHCRSLEKQLEERKNGNLMLTGQITILKEMVSKLVGKNI